MSDWDGAEALFCRRDTSKTRIEDEHHNLWLPAVVEVLDAAGHAPVNTGRVLTPTQIRTKQLFDPSFLSLVLCDVLPEVDELDELALPDALERLDRRFGKMGLAPAGDFEWQQRFGPRVMDLCARLYAGPPDTLAAVIAAEGIFEVIFLSELEGGSWIVTGLADDLERLITTTGPDGLPVPHPRVRLQSLDESLAKIASAHKSALKKSKSPPAPAPTDSEGTAAAFEQFLGAAFA
jgi:hypothetical protein